MFRTGGTSSDECASQCPIKIVYFNNDNKVRE